MRPWHASWTGRVRLGAAECPRGPTRALLPMADRAADHPNRSFGAAREAASSAIRDQVPPLT